MAGKPSGLRLSSGEEIRLKDSDFLGEGGEGSVWRWKGKALKVALDEGAFASRAEKIRMLSKIRHPSLITPLEIALGPRGDPIGYLMDFAPGEPLARHFSMAWQAQAGLTGADLEAIGGSMGEALAALHAAGGVGGDINEFNWAVEKGRAALFDCDAWGIGPYPVSAMMPSIADPLAGGRYGEKSDWFALAVLLFQLFAGAHPYRGRHPARGKGAWAERMAAGESLMDPGAAFPPGARGLGGIPPGLEAWLRETLSHREREAPPPAAAWGKKSAAKPAPAPAPAPKSARRRGRILEEVALPAEAIGWIGEGAILLADGSAWDLASASQRIRPSGGAKLIRTPQGKAVWIWREGSDLAALDDEKKAKATARLGQEDELEVLGGRVFALGPSMWREIEIRDLAGRLSALPCAQGALAGRRFAGNAWGIAQSSLGGIALLSPSEKRGGGLIPRWERGAGSAGERIWGAWAAAGAWALGKRGADGSSWWEIRAEGVSARVEADLADFAKIPAGWIAIGAGEAFLLEGAAGAAEADWPAGWKSPRAWGGAIWVLEGRKALRVGL